MVVYSVCMLSYHVKAEADRNQSDSDESRGRATFSSGSSFWDRVQLGPNALETLDKILFGALILMAFELLDYISKNFGRWGHAKLIPVRGKHLDELSGTDLLFIGMNKAATAPFVYILLRYAYFEPKVIWDFGKMSLVRRNGITWYGDCCTCRAL
jgi:hypothetical protein